VVELRRRHRALKLGSLHDLEEEAIGVEQHISSKPRS